MYIGHAPVAPWWLEWNAPDTSTVTAATATATAIPIAGSDSPLRTAVV